MTIMELGALGELLGAIGVIATLVYLSVQVDRTPARSVPSNVWRSRRPTRCARMPCNRCRGCGRSGRRSA